MWCGVVCCAVLKALSPKKQWPDGHTPGKMQAGRDVCLYARCVLGVCPLVHPPPPSLCIVYHVFTRGKISPKPKAPCIVLCCVKHNAKGNEQKLNGVRNT